MEKRANGERQVAFEKQRGVTDVTVVRNLSHALVYFPPDPGECTDCQLRVFQALAEGGIPIYLIKLHDEYLSFVLEMARAAEARKALDTLPLKVSIADSMAIVSVIASNMRDSFGIMARIVEALLGARVEILQTGDSHNSVTCLVRDEQISAAVKALKKEFGLGDQPVTAEAGAQ